MQQLRSPGVNTSTHADSAIIRVAGGIIIISFLLSALYLGRIVLEPLAIAVLLAFILAPPIRRLRRLHVGRVSSVILVVVFAFAVIGALAFVMETEVTRLATDLPQYQDNLRKKITSLNSALIPSGALKRASNTLSSLAEEFNSKREDPVSGTPETQPRNRSRAPIPVIVQPPEAPTFEYLQNLINPFITPLTMGGLIVLFLIFILFYREDLRDRVLRLAGHRDLQRTTAAMNDAGKRLSRYFLIQSAINGCFGLFIAVMLMLIGVPNSILWGMLAAILRFVPYIGTPIAAIFPLVLAAAIDPGWSKVIATAALFLVSEGVTGQAIEPVLQGQHTGLSPIAVVLSQLFWTLIWGPPGLVLAVPITVCIAVLGNHIEALKFLGVLLGDEPALEPHEGFYQRILANDATEATFQAEERLAEESLSDYYDDVPMKALALAHADAREGKLPQGKQMELLDTIEAIVEELADYSDADPSLPEGAEEKPAESGPEDGPASARDDVPALPIKEHQILLISARDALDQSASLLLADILGKRGLSPAVAPFPPAGKNSDDKPSLPGAQLICVSCFGSSFSAVRYLIRRWRRRIPGARFVACFWQANAGAEKLEEWRQMVGAEFIATSLKEAAEICNYAPGSNHVPAASTQMWPQKALTKAPA